MALSLNRKFRIIYIQNDVKRVLIQDNYVNQIVIQSQTVNASADTQVRQNAAATVAASALAMKTMVFLMMGVHALLQLTIQDAPINSTASAQGNAIRTPIPVETNVPFA